jgi:hypothetical protein
MGSHLPEVRCCRRHADVLVLGGMAGTLLIVSLCSTLFIPIPVTFGRVCLVGGWASSLISVVIAMRRWKRLNARNDWSYPGHLASIVASTCLISIALITVVSVGINTSYLATKGVARASGPLLLENPPYLLNFHGEYTEVDRAAFLIKGIAAELGWHGIFLAVSIICVFFGLFGCLPWPLPLLC